MKHKFYLVTDGQLIQLAVYVRGAVFQISRDEQKFKDMLEYIKTQSVEIETEE